MNNSLKFDGTSYVTAPFSWSKEGEGPITIEFWAKFERSDVGTTAFHFEQSEAKPSRVLCHAPWWDGNLYWDYGDIRSDGRISTEYKPFGKWAHVALVSAGSAAKGYMAIYIDGNRVAQQESSSRPDQDASVLVIGAAKLGTEVSQHFIGSLDSFRVWDHVRSKEQIQRNMNVELMGDEKGLVACFNFNWGFQNYLGANLWGERLNKLPNSVPTGEDGTLNNFEASCWVASGVRLEAPVGPVYRLTNGDGKRQFFTAKDAERKEKTDGGWTDDGIAFYAHRGAAPGTAPLYRLYNSTTDQYRITSDVAVRDRLDTRLRQGDEPGDWVDEGEIAYVANAQNGDGVPLYRGHDADSGGYVFATDQADIPGSYSWETECYVLPGPDSKYKPQPIAFDSSFKGLSDNLWHVLVCRSYKEGWGLMLGDDNVPVLAEIPTVGAYPRFQWRLDGFRLRNRAVEDRVLVLADGNVKSADYEAASTSQAWTLRPVKNKGTVCFGLEQSGKGLACASGTLEARSVDASSSDQEWTLLAMELVEGCTLPGPPPSHGGLPFSKYLEVDGVHIVGTGTVTDWAMLRVKLIVENMLGALKESVDRSPMEEMEVFVVSRDDSHTELEKAPAIGMGSTADHIGRLRGLHGGIGVASYCYVTEEAMWKTGVFASTVTGFAPAWRRFDQVVHEFAHLMDNRLALAGAQCPVSTVGLTPKESFAISVQSWFDSLSKVGDTYKPATRAELKKDYQQRYDYLARSFDPENTWLPPVEPRRPREFRRGWSMDDGDFKIDLDAHGNLKIYHPTGGWWSGTKQAHGLTPFKMYFSNNGDLMFLDESSKVIATFSQTAGTWPFRLAAEPTENNEAKLVVKDGLGLTLYKLLPESGAMQKKN